MVGIVILNYNTPNDVFQCVNSIKETTNIPYRIIIVDNCSKDNSQVVIKERFNFDDKISLIFASENLGYSAGNNLGIKEALKCNCTNILFVNPDVIFYKSSIETMVKTLDSDAEIGVVGPKIIQKDGTVFKYKKNKTLTYSQYIFERKPFRWFDFLNLRKLHDDKYDFEEIVKFYGAISGCCFCVPASIFQKISVFDENVFIYYEEDILATKLRTVNLKACINPNAEVMHFHSGSIGDVGAPFVRMQTELSALYFLRVYKGVKRIKFWLAKKLSIFVFSYVTKKHNQDISYVKLLKEKIKSIEKFEPYSVNIKSKLV